MLSNKVLVITGTSSGVGKASAKLFIASGWKVIGIDIHDAPKEFLKLKAYSHFICDVRDEKEVQKNFRKIFSTLSKQSLSSLCLFSCAGRALPQEFEGFPNVNVWKDSIELNLNSHFYVFSNFYKMLEVSHCEHSSVLFMSSINAKLSAGLPAYSAAKSGLIGLTTSLAKPLAEQYGTTVNCLLCGSIMPSSDDKREKKDYEAISQCSLLGKIAEEDDIAKSVLSILINMPHMTGTTLTVDGGQSVYFPDF